VKSSHVTRALSLLALVTVVPSVAHAGRDSYGVGTGRNGALTVAGAMPTVVNTYTTLASNVAAGATVVTVGSAMGFTAGDLVLIYRSNGALMSVPAAPPMGMPAPAVDLSASAVGRWELARVRSIAGANLTLDEALVNGFDATGTQVIRVPEYTTVTVNMGATLAAQAWNGTTGGVLAFFATGAISNAGTISADSRGFRGGAFVNADRLEYGCTALEERAGRGQFSGESVNNGAFGVRRGRGYLANGGGGGICHNAGGGGGGNGGRGGMGGRTWNGDGSRAVGGYGGTALTYSLLDHGSFGGGGGAGDGNNDRGTSGGIGGGLIFVRADSLAGNGQFSADGQSLGNAGPTGNDGQGGGGAGGSIYLRLRGAAACGSIHANGGNGGSTGYVEPHGTGGGGGGGHILVQTTMRAASCTLSVNNGLAGTQGNAMAVDGVNYGATPTAPNTPDSSGVVEAAPTGGFVILTAPVTVTPANGSSTGARRPAITGTAPANSSVLVFVDGVLVGTVMADAAGNWSFTPGSDLALGMHSVNAIANDPVQRVFSVVSNTNTFTVAVDTDGDGVADETDADDDNDGVTDVAEGNGRDPSRDTDGDGTPDYRDRDFAGFVDSNMDGVDDRVDTDLDGTPNHLDLDADGDSIFDVLENGNGALDTNRDGRIDGNTDADRDGLRAGVDSNDADAMIITPSTAPIDTDMDMRIDALDPDDDNDNVPTRNELGAGGPYMPRNTDGTAGPGVTTDTRPDYLDADDDGDGIDTSAELGAGGFMNPLNSDATVPMGQGTADANPNYLDPDDDGDSIPTAVERTIAGATPDPDADMLPAWLDRDSDGDTVFDIVEAGAAPLMPANSDTDSSRDFLDTDSDNDCVPDSDAREAGAARTNPAVPSMNVNANCPAAAPICTIATGVCSADRDTDMDGVPDMVETRIGTNPMNPDSDMDGVPDGREVGAGPAFMTRDTDMDGTIDALDTDDDGDGVLTRDELGAGGFMMPRNTDAMVPMGMGTGDMLPDYLDPDDDGDSIPTRVEVTLEGMTAGDSDMIPAYLDLDSDGDGVPDSVEVGSAPATPANSDGMAAMGDRPDFLDTDSDNDCVADSDMREMGAARTDASMPAAMVNNNCMAPTPVCDVSVGMCVGTVPADGGVTDASADGGSMSADSGAMDGSTSVPSVLSGDGACACRAPAAGGASGDRGVIAVLAMGGLALVYGARRKRSGKR